MKEKEYDLREIIKHIEDGTIDYERASNYMTSKNIQMMIHGLVDMVDNDVLGIDDSIAELAAFFTDIAYYIYNYSDFPTGLTDPEYDKLCDLLIINGKEEFSSLREPKDNGKDHHMYPMLRGTLAKVHYLDEPEEKNAKSRRSLDKWIKKTEAMIKDRSGKVVNLKEEYIYVFPKWDGVSVIFEFDEQGWLQKALTRGYTKLNTADNVTHHFIGFERPCDEKVPYGLKTEVMVEEKTVEEYNLTYKKDFSQSRSIASGIINTNYPDERNKYLVIMQLRQMTENDKIEKLCPEVFKHPFLRCKLGDYVAIENFAQAHRITEGLRCDGVVLHIINPELQEILGRENDKNNFEVAYKFTEEYAYSTVKDIEFQTGMLGRVTPVVKIEPIKMKGNIIKKASLSNIDRLEELKFAKGDDIKILYDIIPYATKDDKCKKNKQGNKPILPKEVCSECGSKLERKGAFLFCNNLNCNCRVKGKILNYIVKMKIQGISYATIDFLYNKGIVMSIADLYNLEKCKRFLIDEHKKSKAEYSGIAYAPGGFGEVVFDNWVKQINERKTVNDYVLLGALGIEGVGEKNFEKIFDHFTIKDLFEIAKTDSWRLLDDIKGIGRTKAKSVVNGILLNQDLIEYLYDELDVLHTNSEDVKFTICFTKVKVPLELEEEIISLGGKITDTMNSTVSYLVVADKDVTSTKTKYANEHGISIITIEELPEKLEKYKEG